VALRATNPATQDKPSHRGSARGAESQPAPMSRCCWRWRWRWGWQDAAPQDYMWHGVGAAEAPEGAGA
jgi:hypothetical protein